MNRHDRRAYAKTRQRRFAQALELHRAGRHQEADRICREILDADPNDINALHLSGYMAHEVGLSEVATRFLARAIGLNDGIPLLHSTLALALIALGRLDEAAAALRRALALAPNDGDTHASLGYVLHRQGALDEAEAACRRALVLKPENAEPWNTLGAILRDRGRREEAIAAFRRALAARPGYVEAHHNLGAALGEIGELDQAIDALRQAIAANPGYAQTHSSLGAALVERGDLEEGEAALRRAIALDPTFSPAYTILSVALRNRGRLVEAIETLRAGLAARPGFVPVEAELIYARALACDWSAAPRPMAQLVAAAQAQPFKVQPYKLLTQPSTAADQLLCARQWVAATAASAPLFDHSARPPQPRIRVGYLSEEFGFHPVSALIAELIERHDRSRFEIAAYAVGRDDGSAMRARLRAAFDRFVEMPGDGAATVARRIDADGIDILVDLSGLTHDERTPKILSLRPAPIQVGYLGFPATMGAGFVDYAIVDPWIVPPEQQPFHAERLVHLPHSYQPSDTRRPLPAEPPGRKECGLPEQGFVFCSFNNNMKITPAVFDIWMRLLQRVPDSVLWLAETNPLACENVWREAAKRGVPFERVIFTPRTEAPEYLAKLTAADLFLDTLPYNAGATANDALWAGLPIVTCSGETYVGRMAGSALRAAGLPELVTSSLAEYETLALRLATEPGLLAAFRDRLTRNRREVPLFDIAGYTRHLEAAYTRMWETWRRGAPAEPFAVEGRQTPSR